MAKAIFQVAIEPFDCTGCFKKLEDELLHTTGIISVKVFPQIGRVRLEFKETEISPKQLEIIIVNFGYQIESKKLA